VSKSLRKGLETLALEYADILLLGWHEKAPKESIMEAVEEERRMGTFKHLAISSHQRRLFREFMEDGRYDVFHLRYNAANVGAEEDVFPYLPGTEMTGKPVQVERSSEVAAPPSAGPGIVAFTVLRWGDLLDPRKMPPGKPPLTASECYRFALSNRNVHVAVAGPSSDEEMRHTLGVLKAGPLDAEEMARVRAIGDHVYRQKSAADWFR